MTLPHGVQYLVMCIGI